MRRHIFFITFVFIASSILIPAQDVARIDNAVKGLPLGPGDKIAVSVQGEKDYDFVASVDEDGRVEVPFADKPVMAMCMTERDLRMELTQMLEKYLRSPQVNVEVRERKSRPPATVYGEVNAPGRFEMMRKATLVELLAFSGGVKEEAAGLVQVSRPQPPLCMQADDKDNWWAGNTNKDAPPTRIFSLANIKVGRDDSNPVIYPGDVIYVQRAPVVNVIGEVISAQGIYLKDSGLSLTQAIAKVGGPRREADTKLVSVKRRKPGSDQYDDIAVNYQAIMKGKAKDVLLQPDDIVVVGLAKPSIAHRILEIAAGAAKTSIATAATAGPYRVIY